MSEAAAISAAKAGDAPRVTAARLVAFTKRAFEAAGLPAERRRSGRHADGRSRPARLRHPRRHPPADQYQAAQGRRQQSAPEHSSRAGPAVRRAGRWRQRHRPSGDALRDADRDREGEATRRRLGRRAHEQSRRPRRALRHHAARARHDRHLSRGRQQQPSAAVGVGGEPARHQSDRDRDPGRRRAADRARHGADRRGVRQGPAQGAARRGDAGRLDDRPRRQAADRCQAHGRRTAACRSANTRATA